MNFSGPQIPKEPGCRRRFPRYRADLKLTVLVLGQDGHFEINGLCNQIAEGGLGAIISSELSVGEMVNLQLSIPIELQPILLRAVVRWRNRLQHGFEFFGISLQQRALIRDYCKDLTEQGQT
jgi:hypothetical protein